MPGITTELGLSTAVDSDDTADYLVLNLADSLRTLDALFNNVTGHDHSQTHEGGPILASSLRGPHDIGDWFRSTGRTTPFGSTGIGLEMYWSGTAGVLQSFNRATSAYAETQIFGTKITLGISGGSNLVVNTDGSIAISGALTTNGALTVSGGQITANNGLTVQGSTGLTVSASGGLAVSGSSGLSVTTAISAGTTISATGAITSGARVTALDLMMTGSGAAMYFNSSGTIYLTTATDPDAGVGTVIRAVAPNGLYALQFVPSGGNGFFAHSSRAGAPANEVRAESHLHVPGTVWCTNVSNLSSKAFKTDLTAMTPAEALGRVLDARVEPYTYTLDPAPPAGSGQMVPANIGFAAEDMAQVCPEVVAQGTVNGQPGQPMAIDYGSLVAVVWGAIRQLDTRLNALEAA